MGRARVRQIVTRDRRFLVPELGSKTEIEIRGEEAHHLLHVLRLKSGDEVFLFDGRGLHYRARLTDCGRNWARASLRQPLPSLESQLDLTLAVAIPKAEALALVVEKATELGVTRIVPLLTERTTVQAGRQAPGKLSRWRRIAVEASKQCGRSRVPSIEDVVAFTELVSAERPGAKILASPAGGHLPEKPIEPLGLAAVGPEGGWTDAELALARDHGFHFLCLGPRTLRTETAAVTVVALLQSAWGDSSV